MAWQDRLRNGAYTSPETGQRLTFDFEDLKQSFEKKAEGFEFPDAAGTFVQDNGKTGRRIPMQLYFHGNNYDLEADAFMLALGERGVGRLEHPLYGDVKVVPFGKVTREDRVLTAGNQALVTVVFWETTGIVYPLEQTDLSAETLAAVARFNDAQAADYADGIGDAGALRQSILGEKYEAFLDSAADGLRDIADTQQNVQRQFDAQVDSINRGIDVLVQQPLTLAFQTSIMLQAPARALTAIGARLSAYANLAASIITPTSADEPGAPALDPDELYTRDLYAASYVSGSVVSVVNASYDTRVEALTAAENLLEQLDLVVNWREVAFADAGEVDTGGSYQELQEAVSLAAALLISASFSLKVERTIVLTRARTPIDLAAELYGEGFEGELDFFYQSNDLSGSEHLELPRGRRIVYYV